MPPEILAVIAESISQYITNVFRFALIGIGVAALFVFLMGKDKIALGSHSKEK